MAYFRPVPVLYWAPSVYPGGADVGGKTAIYGTFSDFGNAVWQPFPLNAGTSRIVSFESSRGRRSTRENFAAGTLTVVLDNSDGTLDPSKSGSTTSGKYAGIPFRLAMRDSAGVEHPIFAGLLDSGWLPSWGPGRKARTVTITVTDYYGYAAHLALPGSCANYAMPLQLTGAPSRVWWRGPMNGQLATTTNNVSLWDFGPTRVNGRLSTGGCGAGSALANGAEPAAVLASSSSFYRPGADFNPGTRVCAWTGYNVAAAPSSNAILIGCRDAATSNPKWLVGMNTSGQLFCAVYNAAAAGVCLISTTGSYVGTSMVGVDIDFTARTVNLYTPAGVVSGSWAVPSAGAAGRLVIEAPSSGGFTISDWSVGGSAWAFTRVSSMSGSEPIALNNGPIDRHSVDLPPIVDRPTDYNSLAGQISTFAPQQAYLDACANAFGGVTYCRRDGQIVLRAGEDLGYWPASRGATPVVSDNMYQVVGRVTDQPNPPAYYGSYSGLPYVLPILRYSGAGHSGPDPDRVMNTATIGNARFYDLDSWNRYGPRVEDLGGVGGVVVAGDPSATQAQAQASARAVPTDAAESVVFQPGGDDVLTSFVLNDLELEARVLLTQSDPVTGAAILADVPVRVQSEAWSWADGGERWTVAVALDQPVPNR